MSEDLGALIKSDPQRWRTFGIRRAEIDYLTVRLVVLTSGIERVFPARLCEIVCVNAVEYSIRPKNPNTI
jgi:hypothetical protein